MQMAPTTLLEGASTAGSAPPGTFIPGSPQLDREVDALHRLARAGSIPTDVAERQLNTYLPAATRMPGLPPRWLVLSIADAPHHSLLPDLGYITHRILARCALPGSLSAVLEQCVPFLRHTPRPVPYTDSQDALLNLVLALLLGLYPGGTVKRPGFATRAGMYARVHALLTDTRERQAEFCRRNHATVLMACMEYVARVLPVHMPPQHAFLASREPATSAVFFRRVPALCDEFRQALDPASSWAAVRQACEAMLDKVARLKKSSAQAPPRDAHGNPPAPALLRDTPLPVHWEAPLLHGAPSFDEFRLLARSLGLSAAVLQSVQQDVRVYRLPANLRQMQAESLARVCGGVLRSSYLRSRLTVCMQCALTSRNILQARLRLDTLRQTLMCSACEGRDLLSVDMLGRVLRHRRQTYLLCPCCCTIQPYRGEQAWRQEECAHRAPRRSRVPVKVRRACCVCQEYAYPVSAERVDHLTGEMRVFHFCTRHMPRGEALFNCVNARQLAAFC